MAWFAVTLVATNAESKQRIVLTDGALAHIGRHKQMSWWAREAGGQLFGRMTEDEVIVSNASGPYRGDQRSRCSYRSNPKAAQQAINRFAAQGHSILGNGTPIQKMPRRHLSLISMRCVGFAPLLICASAALSC